MHSSQTFNKSTQSSPNFKKTLPQISTKLLRRALILRLTEEINLERFQNFVRSLYFA
jgi:hypothetical protein